MIYRPAVFCPKQKEWDQYAIESAKMLIPDGLILSKETANDVAHLMLHTTSQIIAFEFYAREEEDEVLELVLRAVTDLKIHETRNGGTLGKKPALYLITHHFSESLLKHLSFEHLEAHLFQWRWIRSETHQAMLIEEYKVPEGYKTSPPAPSLSANAGSSVRFRLFRDELSVPEQIAFSHFGIELRNRLTEHHRL